MATSASGGDDGREESTWDAYADLEVVSKQVTETIKNALEAYALLDKAGQHRSKIRTGRVVELEADILAAAMRLSVELEAEADRDVGYAIDILDRWQGDDGYIQRFRQTSVKNSREPWIHEFVSDIRRAGWELGYLQAGKREENTDNADSSDGEVRAMIEGMTRA